MFNSSQDLLNLLLGVSSFLVAAVLALLLYRLALIIQDFRHLSKSLKNKVEALDAVTQAAKKLITSIQDKLEHSSAYLGILIELVTKVVDYLKNKKTRDKKQTSNKT